MLKQRHKIVAFYGVPTSGGTVNYTRMKYFTQLSKSKNAQEYSRKYVDEKAQRTDVVSFAPQYDYAFDRYAGDPVLTDIINITDNELLGSEAIRSIVLVDVDTGAAFKRDYSIIPSSEGDDANVYTHSGSFKANGDQISGTATTSDNWQTIMFTSTAPSVSFVSSSVSMVAGAQVGLAVEVSPRSAQNSVSWNLVNAGDSSYVRLGNSASSVCVANGLTAGTASVRASITVDGQTYSDTCTVTVTAS